MKYLILLFLLSACAKEQVILPVQEPIQSAPETSKSIPETKWKIGQCLYLVDHLTGKGNPKDILKVDNITETKYIYRWWIYLTNSWSIDTSDGIGEFKLFESMTRESECPRP